MLFGSDRKSNIIVLPLRAGGGREVPHPPMSKNHSAFQPPFTSGSAPLARRNARIAPYSSPLRANGDAEAHFAKQRPLRRPGQVAGFDATAAPVRPSAPGTKMTYFTNNLKSHPASDD